ncbi:polyphosphate kinase 2 family protein [Williamwhitmania taraxaci]|uniref:Polyphosphate:AMP phosphotransferase n=1 Tax=Williamwhitmania taraxaci TaxID=1640674 RepID=A0A1G6GVX6_9BACT|nr:polyphosphate kinase 2 family protein [Williamwhitmania taraxaci]SDB85286.1 Polyphosphate:AMP phosphotransferase [Williamwhitmania taraxaci]
MGNNNPELLFKFPTNGKGSLKNFSTNGTDGVEDKDHAKNLLEENLNTMIEHEDLLYASDRNSVLIIFQAMDAAGKDGTIKHVMSGLNPQSCQVYSFKQPSKEELDHDFLWRNYRCMPERGRIGIFNRSYYEEVLVVRVHPEILLKQQLPGLHVMKDISSDIWQHRYRSINSMERHLVENGTIIIKFFLHLSKGEQKDRLLARIDDKSKRWKFSLADLKERERWDDYMNAYNEMLKETSTEDAPWYVIPADHKWFMRYAVGNIIAQKLKGLKMEYPRVSEEMERALFDAKAKMEME